MAANVHRPTWLPRSGKDTKCRLMNLRLEEAQALSANRPGGACEPWRSQRNGERPGSGIWQGRPSGGWNTLAHILPQTWHPSPRKTEMKPKKKKKSVRPALLWQRQGELRKQKRRGKWPHTAMAFYQRKIGNISLLFLQSFFLYIYKL